MRVGVVAPNPEEARPELAWAQGLAATLGAEVDPYPAPLGDLKKALSAGVIDLVMVRASDKGRGGQADAAAEEAGFSRLAFQLEGEPADLLVRRGEERYEAVCRRYLQGSASGPALPAGESTGLTGGRPRP